MLEHLVSIAGEHQIGRHALVERILAHYLVPFMQYGGEIRDSLDHAYVKYLNNGKKLLDRSGLKAQPDYYSAEFKKKVQQIYQNPRNIQYCNWFYHFDILVGISQLTGIKPNPAHLPQELVQEFYIKGTGRNISTYEIRQLSEFWGIPINIPLWRSKVKVESIKSQYFYDARFADRHLVESWRFLKESSGIFLEKEEIYEIYYSLLRNAFYYSVEKDDQKYLQRLKELTEFTGISLEDEEFKEFHQDKYLSELEKLVSLSDNQKYYDLSPPRTEEFRFIVSQAKTSKKYLSKISKALQERYHYIASQGEYDTLLKWIELTKIEPSEEIKQTLCHAIFDVVVMGKK